MLHEMLQHPDEHEDVDMIKQVLQKIVDEMDQFESDRLMPESRKPKEVHVEAKVEGSPEEEATESPEEESREDGDSSMLDELMNKAPHADEEGALPEDHEEDLHPAVAAIIRKKKLTLPK